jgi:hypothetical protein
MSKCYFKFNHNKKLQKSIKKIVNIKSLDLLNEKLTNIDKAKEDAQAAKEAKEEAKRLAAEKAKEERKKNNDSWTELHQRRLKHMSEVQGKLDEKDNKLKDMQMNRL